MENKDKLIVFMMVAIFIICSLMLSFVMRHYSELSKNPLIFGAKQYDLEQCTCSFENSKDLLFFDDETIKRIKTSNPFILPIE